MSVHRFKCNSIELAESIKYFSEIHKSDNKEHLNYYFEKWKNDNKDLIQNEKEYLHRNNYENDIEDKIFKSIKYYYIKKFNNPTYKPKQKKKPEFRTPKPIIQEIKNHLNVSYNENPQFKPSDSYKNFETKYNYNSENIKKAYKNQYYQFKVRIIK